MQRVGPGNCEHTDRRDAIEFLTDVKTRSGTAVSEWKPNLAFDSTLHHTVPAASVDPVEPLDEPVRRRRLWEKG